MMEAHFLSSSDLVRFFDYLEKRGDLFVTTRDEEGQVGLKPYSSIGDFNYPGVRAYQPLKPLFFPILEQVAEFPAPDAPVKESRPFTIVGAASCDLRAVEALDRVFLEGDFKDPYYEERRSKCLLVGFDCTEPLETCFCVLVGVKPYPEKGFDLNLSKIEGGYVVEVGSDKGRSVVDDNKAIFKPATENHLSQRDEIRKKVLAQVEKQSKEFKPSGTWQEHLAAAYEDGTWQKNVEDCVECGACLFICPTCQCFLLYDQRYGDRYSRLKMWDTCAYKGFARVAGGANPRERLTERFKHRYYHKLDYFPKAYGFEACTGCGRCIVACPGKIDMREVLKEVCRS
jgi:NAD-dependent dihydropyrimidine dehydrogenase PreA subunit